MKTAKEAMEHLGQYIKKLEQIDQWINIVIYQGKEIVKHQNAEAFVRNGELGAGEQYSCKLHEILNYFPKYLNTLLVNVPEGDMIMGYKNNLLKSFAELSASLTDDEHILMDYMRQSYTHVFQSRYDWEPNKKFKIASLENREVTLDRANEIIQHYYGEFAKIENNNQDRVAQFWLANKTIVNLSLFQIQWKFFIQIYIAGDYRKYLVSKFHDVYESSKVPVGRPNGKKQK